VFYLAGRGNLAHYSKVGMLLTVIVMVLVITDHAIAGSILLIVGVTVIWTVARVIESRRKKAASLWPVAQATVESGSVTVNGGGEGQRRFYIVELSYSYRVANEYWAGILERAFDEENQACDFVDAMKGKTLLIHYDPENAGTSHVPESSLCAILPDVIDARAASPAQNPSA
jgi:hypothetical protein